MILLLGLALPAGPLVARTGPVLMTPPAGPPLFPPPFVAPSVSSGSSYFYVGAQASTTICNPTCTHVTNAGAQTSIQVVSQTVVGCLSYWLGDDSAANLWGQVGYYICNGATPVAFYQIWNLTSGAALTTGTTAVSAGGHTFSMYSQSGSTTWAFALDGTVFGTYDLGASLSLGTYPVQAASEEGLVSGPWIPAQVTFSTAMQTFLTANTNPAGSGWSPVTSAFEPWGGCTSTGAVDSAGGYTCWGIAGNAQDSTVPANSLVVGGSRAAIAAGGNLWNGVASDFTLSASPTSVSVNTGTAARSTITVSPLGSFSGTVALASSVSPASGLTCGLSPSSVTGGSGTSTLSCSGLSGTYTVTVTGTSGSLSHSAAVTVNVSDFTISASPTSLSFAAGSSGASTVTIASLNGFGGTVGLSSGTSPATGLSCSLSPTSVSGSGSSTLGCSGNSAATYTVTVTATSGSLTHSTAVTVAVTSGPVLTLSFAVSGGGSGYTAPTLTYVQGGVTKTATLGTSPTAYTVDASSAWSVTNPLAGSSSSERWQTPQATSGTATASVTIVFSYVHQDAVVFAYSVIGGGSGYTPPTVAYVSFGSASSAATGSSVWADVGSAYTYPGSLGGSSSTEAWRTNTGSGTITAASTLSVPYYHQFLVTFGYAVSGGGSGYAAPMVATTQFGLAVSAATAVATWVDSGATYTFTNPLGGSSATERWATPSAAGTVSGTGTLTLPYTHQYRITFSFSVLGGGSGYSTPTVSYVALGASSTTATGAAVWADAGTAYQFQTPLSGSTTTEAWNAAAPTGTASAAGTDSTTFYHQFLVTFFYGVLGGGTGYSAPTVSYVSFGSATSTGTGSARWADASTPYAYPSSLSGSTTTEAWKTNAASGTIAASGAITVAYTHQFLVTFTYGIQGGGSGYAPPTVAAVQFGGAVSVGTGVATWIDAGTTYGFSNPLGGSSASERWIAATNTGTVAASGTISVTYTHQYDVSFGFTVQGGGSGYTAPTAAYQSMGASASTPMGVLVWADAGTIYSLTNPLTGSGSTEGWRASTATGSIAGSGTISTVYYHQFLVTFAVQVINGNSLPASATLTSVVFGATTSIPASGSSWVDANGAYSYPGTFAGATGERWASAGAPTGTITQSTTVTASYYHQFSVTFAYMVLGGSTGSTAPLVAYRALGSGLNVTAGGSAWADAGSSFGYPASLAGSSSTQRWLTASPAGVVAGTGTVTVTYVHQFWADFTYVVKGGGSGYSAPSVIYSNLSVSMTVLAVTVWVWADAGTSYRYQNPLPGSTASNSWQTNNGVGTAGSSSTYSATYKHQYKVKFQTTSLTGTLTSISPLINVTLFDANVSLAADNVSWVDAGSAYAFPGVFYGPLPGERWITWTAATGLVLGPMNITAAYAHQYYLGIQVNAPDGGTVSGSPGWYNATTSLAVQATADPGWRFQEWIGSGSGAYSGTASAAQVALDGPVTETAVFDVGVTLTASSGGSLEYAYGGTNGWVPAGSSATLFLTPGTNFTVHAAPSLFYQLDGWSGAAGSASTVVLTADAPQTLSASFGVSLYQKPDSLLGLAVAALLVVGLAASLRRHRRKKRERALRLARVRARVRA